MSSAADLLVEIGTEELPPADIRPALQQLELKLREALGALRVDFRRVQAFGTPRRLAIYALDVATRQRPAMREVRGPAARVAFDQEGRPTQAAIGFARSQGLPVEALEVKDFGGGRYAVASVSEGGHPTATLLPQALVEIITGLVFPKTMRWGSGEVRFARPVRWLLALLGSQVLPLEIFGSRAGRRTYGHWVLNPGARTIRHPREYSRVLARRFVTVDPDERQRQIATQSTTLAAIVHGVPILAPHLLEETVMTVEHPVALRGAFSGEFLSLPHEVLATVMQHHQKYFPIEDRQHRLLPYFIAVRDGGRRHLASVREGHEWVLRARLADAQFFFDEDRKHHLKDYLPALKDLVLQAKLGTAADKVERLARLAAHLGNALRLDRTAREYLGRSVRLCKADLVTRLVREFPELQGVIGGIYAALDGEPPEVARAIGEHYRPIGAGDRPPTTQIGALLSLLDRFDAVVGGFAVGLAPTGSQDPYGLRRAGQGIVEIILTHHLSLELSDLIGAAAQGYGPVGPQIITQVIDFLHQRVRALLVDRGIRYDLTDAALSASTVGVLEAAECAHALQAFVIRPAFVRLYTAFDRASRILTAEAAPAPDPELFESEAEGILYKTLQAVQPRVAASVQARDYVRALEELEPLVGPVDRFFDDVLVMANDPRVRANRLSLLRAVAAAFRQVADFSKVVMSDEARTQAATR